MFDYQRVPFNPKNPIQIHEKPYNVGPPSYKLVYKPQ